MKGFVAPSTLTLAMAVLLAVSAAAVGAMAMTALAQPRDYKERIAAVRSALDSAEQTAPRAAVTPYGAKAVCNRPLVPASVALSRDLAARAEASGLKVSALNVGVGTVSGASPRLAPLDVDFAVEGPYEAAIRMTALLETSSPAVFVDRFELRRHAGGVTLKVTGRAFCWTSARR